MLFDFDDQYALFDMTPVDNQFIQEYLPAAKGDAVRVYLYGLMRCYHPEAGMSLAQMARDLNLEEEDIARAYRYWEKRGLVQRVADDPPVYRYISLRQRAMGGAGPELDPEYEAFVESLYSVFDHGRRLHGAEIQTCYEWVEELKLPAEAVLMLLRHMERNKGKNFTIQSAEKVAMEMARENIRTVEEAEDFLSRDQAIVQGTRAVLRRLGKRNAPSQDQLELYRKWVQTWGFTPEAILEACAETAKGDPTMGFLDGILRNIHERAVPGERMEASDVLRAREEGSGLKKVLKALGSGAVTEDSLAWYRRVRERYDEKLILLAARECGRSQGNTEDLEKLLLSWEKKGIRTPTEAEAYVRQFRAQGELLRDLRNLWGVRSLTGEKNRAMISAWEGELGFTPEQILWAAEAANGTDYPMSYLDTVLRSYAAKGIRTKEAMQAERQRFQTKAPGKSVRQSAASRYEQRSYEDEEETVEEMMRRLKEEIALNA